MKKGIHDIPFLECWNIEQFLEKIAQSGIEGIELNLHEESGFLDLNTTMPEVRTIAEKVKQFGLEVPSLSTGLHNHYALTSDQASLRKQGEEIALRMIEIAAELGTRIIQVVPGTVSGNVPYEHAYERSQESLALLASEASAAGIIIGIENVCNKFLPSPMEYSRFLNEINHQSVKAYFDTGNAQVTGHPEHFINLIGNQIVAIHVKDYRAATGDFVSPLSGDAEWPTIMNGLHECGYEGYLISTPPKYKYCIERLLETASSDLTALLGLVPATEVGKN